jgi:alkylhydroperoxidase family enzyme
VANIEDARKAVVTRLLHGEGQASPAERRAAFENAGLPETLKGLVEKVATNAHRVTDGDFAAARAAGLTEDQIFEIVVCAAVGQTNRQYERAMAALESAMGKE